MSRFSIGESADARKSRWPVNYWPGEERSAVWISVCNGCAIPQACVSSRAIIAVNCVRCGIDFDFDDMNRSMDGLKNLEYRKWEGKWGLIWLFESS